MVENTPGPIPEITNEMIIDSSLVDVRYGHVPFNKHIELFTDERERILAAKGISFDGLLEGGVRVSVDDEASQFLRELKEGDAVTITTNISELETKIEFLHKMEREGKLASRQTLHMGLRSIRKFPINIPSWLSDQLRQEI
jgi:acyl-CoA thioesterase FadM